ncbi:hypothetical protein BT96DRAFT_58750 [Gymnopus androsaceus JB14]|uniref:RRM domain-containing protein n=1 Tax=Gymnopus androsaceus JB14 TaxID=1447944 RepID=A0A6A4IDE1_9AGAR|nr:hypothetical protein BT96DRAFT_58750 [Gymnopus androsaceus JB14]
MDNMSKSLDEIIKTRPKNSKNSKNHSRRGSNRSARAQVLGNSGASPAARQHIKAVNTTQAQPAATQQLANKIMVSNLPQDVNEQQVRDLFVATVGPLREVTLHYDSNGRSKGVASVLFQRKGDGTKAFEQYNNRLIDGS